MPFTNGRTGGHGQTFCSWLIPHCIVLICSAVSTWHVELSMRKKLKIATKSRIPIWRPCVSDAEVIVICRPWIENLRYLIEIWSAETCTFLEPMSDDRLHLGRQKNRPINISHEQSSVVKTWRNRRIRRRRTRRCGFSCFVTCIKRMLSC